MCLEHFRTSCLGRTKINKSWTFYNFNARMMEMTVQRFNNLFLHPDFIYKFTWMFKELQTLASNLPMNTVEVGEWVINTLKIIFIELFAFHCRGWRKSSITKVTSITITKEPKKMIRRSFWYWRIFWKWWKMEKSVKQRSNITYWPYYLQ